MTKRLKRIWVTPEFHKAMKVQAAEQNKKMTELSDVMAKEVKNKKKGRFRFEFTK